MNTLHFTYILLFVLSLSMTLFAASVKVFFTDDELNEMGIHIEPSDFDGEEIAA